MDAQRPPPASEVVELFLSQLQTADDELIAKIRHFIHSIPINHGNTATSGSLSNVVQAASTSVEPSFFMEQLTDSLAYSTAVIRSYAFDSKEPEITRPSSESSQISGMPSTSQSVQSSYADDPTDHQNDARERSSSLSSVDSNLSFMELERDSFLRESDVNVMDEDEDETRWHDEQEWAGCQSDDDSELPPDESDDSIESLEDGTIDALIEDVAVEQAWPSVNPVVDKLWDEFVGAESRLSGLPISMLVKPGGYGPILLALHYAPLNETAFQEFGVTPDASQPCIAVMAHKMGVAVEEHALLAPGLWFELCFRRCVVPPRGASFSAYRHLSKEILNLHSTFRLSVWKASTQPLALLLGKPSTEWHRTNIYSMAVIPFSNHQLFGEKACIRVEADKKGNITRLAISVLHPCNAFYSLRADKAEANDYAWNIILACAGMRTYDAGYFARQARLDQETRNAALRVRWGALGLDVAAFIKATRRYEIGTGDLVAVSEFPAHITKTMAKLGIKLGDSPAPQYSPSLLLAREVIRLRGASSKDLDYPFQAYGREIHRQMGYPGLKKGLETNRRSGWKNLDVAREVERRNGWPGLRKGWKTLAAMGHPELRKGRETHRRKGYPNLRNVTQKPGWIRAREREAAAGYPTMKKGSQTYVANAMKKSAIEDAKVLEYEKRHGGYDPVQRAKELTKDKKDLENGVAQSVIDKRVRTRATGRRRHVRSQERAVAAGIPVTTLRAIERDLAKHAKL